jgi:hypothetical protein
MKIIKIAYYCKPYYDRIGEIEFRYEISGHNQILLILDYIKQEYGRIQPIKLYIKDSYGSFPVPLKPINIVLSLWFLK